MSALDPLLAELAAAVLAYEEARKAERETPPLSYERMEARSATEAADLRLWRAERALRPAAVQWAAERAASFITPANDSQAMGGVR